MVKSKRKFHNFFTHIKLENITREEEGKSYARRKRKSHLQMRTIHTSLVHGSMRHKIHLWVTVKHHKLFGKESQNITTTFEII